MANADACTCEEDVCVANQYCDASQAPGSECTSRAASIFLDCTEETEGQVRSCLCGGWQSGRLTVILAIRAVWIVPFCASVAKQLAMRCVFEHGWVGGERRGVHLRGGRVRGEPVLQIEPGIGVGVHESLGFGFHGGGDTEGGDYGDYSSDYEASPGSP